MKRSTDNAFCMADRIAVARDRSVLPEAARPGRPFLLGHGGEHGCSLLDTPPDLVHQRLELGVAAE
jgi:hypothetical protein